VVVRARAAALLAALLTSSCTGGSVPDTGPGRPTASAESDAGRSVAAASQAEPPSPPPTEGACYRLSFEELTQPSTDADEVDCDGRHTAQTLHVGELDTVSDGHALSLDSEHVRKQLTAVCPRQLARFLGGSVQERRLSRFEVVWFTPGLSQADRGARWFRCDVVALAGDERLFRLERPRRLRGVLDREDALATYGLCGTAAPGTRGFSRVICARPHAWRAVATIRISGGRDYPGESTVRDAGEQACADRARAMAEDPLRFRYGWEWPSRDQWQAGQHYGYCWMPD
jgi:hypothetical protein